MVIFFLQRIVLPMKERLSLYDCMLTAMCTNDLPCLGAIMRKTHEWGWGLKRLVPLLEDTLQANRMHFGVDGRHLPILLYCLHDPAGLKALSAEKILPSIVSSVSPKCSPAFHADTHW